jgi:hypothetical protein
MSFDPNQVQTPEPAYEPPGEAGAAAGTPHPGAGDTAAGADQASGEEDPRDAQIRQLNERVGLLSQELQTRYAQVPAAPQYQPPQAAAAPAAPEPPQIKVEVPEEALGTFDDYGIPRETVASFAQAIGQSVHQEILGTVLPMVHETTVNLSYAADVSNRFFQANKDLDPYRQDMKAAAFQFMGNPAQARGRSIEECLPEIGNLVRLARNLPGAVQPGQAPSALPREAASMEAAQTAQGGTAGGAARQGAPPAAVTPKKKVLTPGEEYIKQRGDDHVNRVLGGTRLGKKALEGTKVK